MVHEPKETNPITPDTRNEEKESDYIRIRDENENVENADEDEEESESNVREKEVVQATRRSTRVGKPVDRLIEQEDLHTVGNKVRFLDDQHNLVTQVSPNPENDVMYSEKRAFLIAKLMLQINEKITTTGICFGQQFMLHRGLKRF